MYKLDEGTKVLVNKGKDGEYTGEIYVCRYNDDTALVKKDGGGFRLEWKWNVETLEGKNE